MLAKFNPASLPERNTFGHFDTMDFDTMDEDDEAVPSKSAGSPLNTAPPVLVKSLLNRGGEISRPGRRAHSPEAYYIGSPMATTASGKKAEKSGAALRCT